MKGANHVSVQKYHRPFYYSSCSCLHSFIQQSHYLPYNRVCPPLYCPPENFLARLPSLHRPHCILGYKRKDCRLACAYHSNLCFFLINYDRQATQEGFTTCQPRPLCSCSTVSLDATTDCLPARTTPRQNMSVSVGRPCILDLGWHFAFIPQKLLGNAY